MGLKVKAGMALGGLVLSWAFGLNFLSGIASYVDSTGNILVDIADGIGLVSHGIEMLENYLEPPPKGEQDPLKDETPPGGGADMPESPPVPVEAVPAATEAPPTAAPAPQPVICKKGKCAPYDPSKDRVLQQQLIKAEREKILQQVRTGELPPDTVIPARLRLEDEDEIDEDDIVRKRPAKKVKKASPTRGTRKGSKKAKEPTNAGTPDVVPVTTATTTPTTVTTLSTTSDTTTSDSCKISNGPEILDPDNPVLPSDNAENTNNECTEPVLPQKSRWKTGFKKVLGSLGGLTGKLKTLILKFVTTVFPWNRRAKRRLTGGDDEE